MRTNKTIIVLGILVLGLFAGSCEKDLELELKEKEGQLVLFSFLTPDSAFNVHLSKSVGHFSVDDFERVYEGNITVSRNNHIVDDFIFPFDQSWAYRDSIDISEGDAFRVEAVDGEGQQISGETVVPRAVPFTLTDTTTIVVDDPGDSQREVLQCQLEIPDPGEENNFYQLLVFEKICSMDGQDTICNRNNIDYPKTDPVFYVRDQEESLLGSVDFEGCFSDHTFDGENYKLSVQLPVEYASPPSGSSGTRKIQFVLVSHTRAYYNYLRSRVIAEYGYELPVVDPIRVYNNVKNGLGVVSAYSASSDSLVFDGG
ncbi:MAG: DUF4249 domain-containing protein [Bacteroidota bacterium]